MARDYSKHFTGSQYEGGMGTNVTEGSLYSYLGDTVSPAYQDMMDIHDPSKWGQNISIDTLLSGQGFTGEVEGIFDLYGNPGMSKSTAEGSLIDQSMAAYAQSTGNNVGNESSWNSETSQDYLSFLNHWLIESGISQQQSQQIIAGMSNSSMTPSMMWESTGGTGNAPDRGHLVFDHIYDEGYLDDQLSTGYDSGGINYFVKSGDSGLIGGDVGRFLYGESDDEGYYETFNLANYGFDDRHMDSARYGLYSASRDTSGQDWMQGPEWNAGAQETFLNRKADALGRQSNFATLMDAYDATKAQTRTLGEMYGTSIGQNRARFGSQGIAGSGFNVANLDKGRRKYGESFSVAKGQERGAWTGMGDALSRWAASDRTMADDYLGAQFGVGSGYDQYLTALDEYASGEGI